MRRPLAIQPSRASTLNNRLTLFHTRPSTSVLSSVEPILYPQSYCSLGHPRIHSLFNQEVFLDRFRTPHDATLSNAAAAHSTLDYGSSGWRNKHRIPRRQFSRRFFLSKDVREGSPVEILLTLPNEITLAGPVRVRCLGRVQRTEPRDEGAIGVVAAIERYEFLRGEEDSKA